MAGTEVGSLYYDLNIDDKNLKKQLDDADKSVKGFGDRVNKYWGDSVDASKKFGLAMVGITAGVVAFGASAVKSFTDSQNQIAQTNAVLKSTGGIAGVTADQVDKLASSLERQTKFSDEDVRSVENLLLTFTSIKDDVFPDATKTVLDMATALGEDTKSASIQLGKALQDPINGITALRRVGVNFSDDQKTVIENLVNTGKTAEAQKMILQELQKEFGGSAEAAGNTFAGQLAKLNNQIDNVKEAIGQLLVAVAVPFLQAILDWFNGIGGVDGVMKLLREELDRIKPYIPIIAGAIFGALVPALVAAAIAGGEFLLTLAPWAALGAGIVYIAQKMGISWDDVKNAIAKLKPYWDDAVEKAKELYQWYMNLSPTIQFLVSPLAQLLFNFQGLKGVVTGFITDLQNLWTWFTNLSIVIIIGQYLQQVLWPALQAVWAAIVQNLWPALQQLWDALIRLWNALNPALTDALKLVGIIIVGALMLALWILVSVLNIVIQVFSGLISIISNTINWISNIISWFGNLVGVAWNTIKTIGDILWHLPQAFKDVVGLLWEIAKGIGGGILSALGNLGDLLYNAGKDLIAGMIKGIKDKFKELAGAVKEAVGDAVGAVKSFLGIHSPSTVFAEIGHNVTAGFVQGINRSAYLAAGAMNNFSDAIISPNVNINPASAVAGGARGNTTRYGDNNIGDIIINDRQDADYFLRRIDRNQELDGMGISPVTGS